MPEANGVIIQQKEENLCISRMKGMNMSDNGSERGYRVFRGDRLQMHLLRVEEKYRSQLLYEQLKAFEDKVCLSLEQFNMDVFHRMFVNLTKRTVVDVRKVKTLGHLRQCYVDLRKALRCRTRHRQVTTTKEEETVVKYFTWFFKFFEYLKELRDNFVARIYKTLFRYFNEIGCDTPDREDTVDSAISAQSMLSFRSTDSGYGEPVRRTPSLTEGDQLNSARSRTEFEETQEARRKYVTRNALLLLGNQFHDIKRLYDTSEIEQLAKRLCHLKERTDHLLDVETSLDKDLLCQDSERYVFHLKIRNIGTENIMRIIPDILIKLEKAVWLARRWLEKDDEKTKDLNAKLDKLTALEDDMNKRLGSLQKEIKQQETELESKSNTLNVLLLREDRSNNLSQSIFDLQKKAAMLKDQMKSLNKERADLCAKMTRAAQENDMATYKQLLPIYQRNKLQRFALERQIATVRYHLDIDESDMTTELEVKPSVIHSTNDVQDRCEEIEQTLEDARKEQKAIQTALIPIKRDKKFVQDQIELKKRMSLEETDKKLSANYVSSRLYSQDSVVDLNAEFLGHSKVGDPLSVFITSLPDEEQTTPVQSPIKTFDTPGRIQRTLVPELVDSEW